MNTLPLAENTRPHRDMKEAQFDDWLLQLFIFKLESNLIPNYESLSRSRLKWRKKAGEMIRGKRAPFYLIWFNLQKQSSS